MDHLKNYDKWLNSELLDQNEHKLLHAMTDADILECFSQDLEFGTGGIRGIMGLGTNRINRFTIAKTTKGLADYLIDNKLDQGVVISYDNRANSRFFAFVAAQVLAAANIKTFVFEQLRPTPMLSFAVRYFEASAGIMITASHNPKEYNGYKLYNHTGAQLDDVQALDVKKYIDKVTDVFDIKFEDGENISLIDSSFDKIYLNLVKDIAINKKKKAIKIVYSPLHGTGSTIIPQFLSNYGYDVDPVWDQMVNDPNFSATLSTNPEEKVSFNLPIEQAKTVLADIVLVTDPDADRMGLAVYHDHKYHLINGNQCAAIILEYLLSNKKYQQGIVFSTVVTTPLLRQITKAHKLEYSETLTGFKYIGNQAKQIEGIYQFVFGAEESYGCLVSDFVRDKDAVQACFIICEIANFLKLKEQTIIDYLASIYQKYGYHLEETINITYQGISGQKKIKKIMDHFREASVLVDNKTPSLVQDFSAGLTINDMKLPKSNVIKFYYDDVWVVVRPSGTEPKLKIYFGSVAKDENAARKNIDKFKNEFQTIIDKL